MLPPSLEGWLPAGLTELMFQNSLLGFSLLGAPWDGPPWMEILASFLWTPTRTVWEHTARLSHCDGPCQVEKEREQS
jgi:hypothetical protein